LLLLKVIFQTVSTRAPAVHVHVLFVSYTGIYSWTVIIHGL